MLADSGDFYTQERGRERLLNKEVFLSLFGFSMGREDKRTVFHIGREAEYPRQKKESFSWYPRFL
jgi:hypothetical protein